MFIQPKHSNNGNKLSLITELRSLIDIAAKQPENKHKLSLYSRRLSISAGIVIDVSHQDIESKIYQFIPNYIKYLPRLIEQLFSQSHIDNWQTLVEEVEQILTSFWIQKNSEVHSIGFFEILDKVYFSHRLIEELHDALMCIKGTPALEWNMTVANLFVHELIGEEYANRLDQTAIELSQNLISKYPLKLAPEHKKDQTNTWPCFCKEQGINLRASL